MKLAHWAIGLAFAGSIVTQPAGAQTRSAPLLQQPASIAHAGFEYDHYLNPSQRNVRPEAPALLPEAAMAPASVGEPRVAPPANLPEEPTPPSAPPMDMGPMLSDASGAPQHQPAAQFPSEESITTIPIDPVAIDPAPGEQPWTIPQLPAFKRMGIKTGGWVQQGFTLNPDDPADRFNGPVTTNDREGEWQMNQAWLYFVRPTNTNGDGWDIGGRFDLVYGTDWRFGKTPGLEDNINGEDNFYGWVFPQFYMELAYNNLTVKMGHFATLTSYETVPAVGNFFYSHNHMMAALFDPLLVTGILGEYKINENWAAVAGMHRGWMMFEDFNDDLDFLGGVKWKSDDQRTTASFMVDTGAQDAAGENNRFSYFLVVTQQFTEKLHYAIQNNVGFEDNGSVVTAGDDAEWYGISQWLVYKLNPKWSVGGRFEWVRDDDGSRMAGVGHWIGSGRGWLGGPGFAGDFYDLSLGVNWTPHPNFRLRPEIRWDWYNGTSDVNGERPFDDGSDNNQFTLATDLIVTF